MGYKLAGYTHLGGVEIDEKVSMVYKQNHNPKYLYTEDIRKFNTRTDLPDELYQLDILDGSPPCTTFSMAGDREKSWGKKKVFNEGQKEQTLDDLVFEYINTIKKLQPKVAILENVAGIIRGNAKLYAKRIHDMLSCTGYEVQVFLLNAASMEVPQNRERVFFIARQKALNWLPLKLQYNYATIPFSKVIDWTDKENRLSEYQYALWLKRTKKDKSFGDIIMHTEHRLSMFNNSIIHRDKPAPTLVSSNGVMSLYDIPRPLNIKEIIQIATFPEDYNFYGVSAQYIVGMSVPPVMMAHVAYDIYKQWFENR